MIHNFLSTSENGVFEKSLQPDRLAGREGDQKKVVKRSMQLEYES